MNVGSASPYTLLFASAATVIDLGEITSDRATLEAASYDVSPAWLAVIMTVPARRIVTVVPDTDAIVGSELANVTGKPDEAVATSSNDASP